MNFLSGTLLMPTMRTDTVTAPLRIFRNQQNIPADGIAANVRAALRDRRINKEVWLVAGRLIDIDVARDRALKGDLRV
ncbi:hypothetical protein [Rhizobium leguminosarum]|uniref:Uncharacterized protein n=1 Tax=Rhizobium leguminosarum TaxID=384 RepID=A0A1B1CHU2_RHILE|nr:hypothetical protein [Rhizobium leguminosarum]ANP89324.1 hypothetical protein BA011_26505 [Rhizobium leguminosarum]